MHTSAHCTHWYSEIVKTTLNDFSGQTPKAIDHMTPNSCSSFQNKTSQTEQNEGTQKHKVT